MTAYVVYGSGPWYVGASLGGGDLEFRNIRRSFALGAGSRSESGDTRGTHLMGRVFGGYWFNASRAWIHGPSARLTYQQAKVDAWSESGTSSSAMTFGKQKRDALMSSLGWQVGGSIGSRPPACGLSRGDGYQPRASKRGARGRQHRRAAPVWARHLGEGLRQRRAEPARRTGLDARDIRDTGVQG